MQVTRDPLDRRDRFAAEVISYAVWLYFRFPLSLRRVEEMLAARGICVTYETVRQWGKKFGKVFADRLHPGAPARGDTWHMDEVVVSIPDEQHWLWRAVDPEWLRARRPSSVAQRF
jgi:putative transposase